MSLVSLTVNMNHFISGKKDTKGKYNEILLNAGAIKLEYSVAIFTYEGADSSASQQAEFTI